MRKIGNALTRNRGEPSSNDILTDLKQCSLVCLFWANRCREHIFQDRTLEINSYEDAEIFRQYIGGGSSRLTPVHQLIHGIYATQRYDRQRSFLHLLYVLVIKDKLQSFSITGPVPDGFGPAKLDTPHWGIPPCVVAPSSFLQKQVLLHHIHLPSFHHVTKYIKHFCCATDILFESITWDGQTPTYSLPQASSTIACHRRPRSLDISAKRDCTDSVHLALTALMLNPNCPLHRLSDEKHVWMIKFMTLLWGDGKSRWVSIEFNVSEQATTMRMDPFHFVFEEATASTDRSASALSVVGVHAYIHKYATLPANLDALAKHASTQPTIRALVLLFYSFDILQDSVKPFVEVLGPATEAIEFVLAYEEEEEKSKAEQDGGRKKTGRVLGADLATLEPSGASPLVLFSILC
ncbi:hypothetical protein BC629DRAFT_969855 [Irpex lacteus]|nr:hypothetical protein BC629DRAFT_969855 [Irpex lacteus]